MNSLRKQFPREYRIWKAMRARRNAPCFKTIPVNQKI